MNSQASNISYFSMKENQLRFKDPNKELVGKLKSGKSKQRKEEYDKLEKIIYSFKTKEDVLNFMLPYIEKGYSKVSILTTSSDTCNFLDFDESIYYKLLTYIINLTDGDFEIEVLMSDIILSLKIQKRKDFKDFRKGAAVYSINNSMYSSRDTDRDKIKTLEDNINDINENIKKLDMTMREVYNAPGMPGFEQTNKHYMQHIRRKSL